jgi:hypothetical protein
MGFSGIRVALFYAVTHPAHALPRAPAARDAHPTMKTPAFRLTALALAFAAQGAVAYEYNVDLKNTGSTTAYDVAVVLDDNETITSTFDGYGSGTLAGLFYDVQTSHPAPNRTVIHWMNMNAADDAIPPGKTIHVGWSSQDCNSKVVDMYWTTKSHARLRDSVLHNVTHNQTYTTGRFPVIDLTNTLSTQSHVRVTDVRFAVVDSPLDLGALSTMNVDLMKSLRPVKQGSFVMAPGQSVRFEIPVNVRPGQSIITVYTTSDGVQGATANQGSSAVNFMQRPVGDGGGHGGGGC